MLFDEICSFTIFFRFEGTGGVREAATATGDVTGTGADLETGAVDPEAEEEIKNMYYRPNKTNHNESFLSVCKMCVVFSPKT